MPEGTRTDLRLGELLAALSLATDLGNGFPLEKALRNCLLATRIGALMGLAGAELSDTYYTAMLRFIGCTAFASEAGAIYGDEIAVKNAYAAVDFRYPKEIVGTIFTTIGKGAGPARRARAIANELVNGKKIGARMIAADCEVAVRLSDRLGMSPAAARAIGQMFERWDGKGLPLGLAGDAIETASRVMTVAHAAEIHLRASGRDGARAFVARGSGGWFDPAIASVFDAHAVELLAEVEHESVWDLVLEAEPEPILHVSYARLDDICRAFADFVDMKSTYLLGHSSAVAELAGAAARALGLADDDVDCVRRAGYLHDLGRTSVPNSIWDKRGSLTAAEWERVRLHSYYTERVLSPSPLLAPVAWIAALHHERLDGSGYHRNATAGTLPVGARILAAADVYQAMTQRRPHRDAMSPESAASELNAMAVVGRLDPDAVDAVCRAAGHERAAAKRIWPAGLTDREVDVLRLIATGATKKDVAKALFISPSTAHTHVVHIYGKVGVSTRAGVALFAMEHGLVD